MKNVASGNSAALMSSVLKQLGHDVPDEQELTHAIKNALRETKVANGMDPENIQYKLAVPIEGNWIKQFS